MAGDVPALRSVAPLLTLELAPAATWSHVLKRGCALRARDLDGGANVATLLYNAATPIERYCMPDTLKAQHTAHLTSGHALYSGEGRVLCSIVSDTCGWHDPIGGHGDAALASARYGARSYQEHGNEFVRNARDDLLVELAKYGLGERDLVPSVNLFSKVVVSQDGALEFVAGNSVASDCVELRAELDTLVVLNSAPHPLDPRQAYAPRHVLLEIVPTTPAAPGDPCVSLCPENERGFHNTWEYLI